MWQIIYTVGRVIDTNNENIKGTKSFCSGHCLSSTHKVALTLQLCGLFTFSGKGAALPGCSPDQVATLPFRGGCPGLDVSQWVWTKQVPQGDWTRRQQQWVVWLSVYKNWYPANLKKPKDALDGCYYPWGKKLIKFKIYAGMGCVWNITVELLKKDSKMCYKVKKDFTKK